MVDNPFTPINCINYKTPPQALELYSPYLTNKFYSYFRETVLIANLGNNFRDMDNDLHFKFYNSIITKKKRFSKWAKSERDEELNIIARYYDISLNKARDVIKRLTEEQRKEIIQFMKEKNNE